MAPLGYGTLELCSPPRNVRLYLPVEWMSSGRIVKRDIRVLAGHTEPVGHAVVAEGRQPMRNTPADRRSQRRPRTIQPEQEARRCRGVGRAPWSAVNDAKASSARPHDRAHHSDLGREPIDRRRIAGPTQRRHTRSRRDLVDRVGPSEVFFPQTRLPIIEAIDEPVPIDQVRAARAYY
jgi:hypothetical protein